jgi:hypothetical protein
MSSSSANKQIILRPLNGTLSLPKIATTTTNTIDRHLAIVAGNAENLRAHLDSMYKLLRPDDRLTLVCFIFILFFFY